MTQEDKVCVTYFVIIDPTGDLPSLRDLVFTAAGALSMERRERANWYAMT